jgi:hypothetical protein
MDWRRCSWRRQKGGAIGEWLNYDLFLKVGSQYFLRIVRFLECSATPTEFADPPPPVPTNIFPQSQPHELREQDPVVPETDAPTTLMQWAVLILNTPNPTLKVNESFFFLESPILNGEIPGGTNTTCGAPLPHGETSIHWT